MAELAVACSTCKRSDCDGDCAERHLIYRERQRVIARDIALESPSLGDDPYWQQVAAAHSALRLRRKEDKRS